MAQQTINIGSAANDGTGDPLRDAFDKANDNFSELYALVASLNGQWKAPVRAASTGAITLATAAENGDSIDGVTLATGDRILLKDQAAPAENGIYVVAASGAPARAADADAGAELVNAAVLVSEGTANADKMFVCTTNAPITLGSTGLTFVNPFAGLGVTAASTTEVLTGTDSAKAVTPDALAALWEQGGDIASAGTISVGEGGYFNVTGTTTITDIDFATDKAGRTVWLKFAGILTLTHHATTLILPTGANITTAAGDVAGFTSEGSDNVRCIGYMRANGNALAGSAGSTINQGVHTVPILAGGMTARTTNGPAAGTLESTTNKVMQRTLDFDADTAEYAQIMIPMHKSWDEGTITVQFGWRAPGGTGNVVWAAQAVAISDDDPIDAAFGTAQSVTDGVTATGDLMWSAFTSAITVGGSPAAEDLVCLQVYRDAANGSDTLATDALLVAIRVKYTINAGDDA